MTGLYRSGRMPGKLPGNIADAEDDTLRTSKQTTLTAPYAWWVQVLIIDGANVVGSRPDGWWRDRLAQPADCTNNFRPPNCPRTRSSWCSRARQGVVAERVRRTRPYSSRSRVWDDAIVDEVIQQVAVGDERGVTVVTADRMLRDRVEVAGASSRSPGWLLDQL